MAKTGRKTAKRAGKAGRGGVQALKSSVSKTRKHGLRMPESTKTKPRKPKPSLQSENARLKRQLKTARMQREASAEILRAVANASGDAAGPLQLIAETTARLFNASSVSLQLAEGSEFTQEYRVGAIAKRVGSAYPRSNIKVGGRNLPGTVVAENRQIHIPDLDRLDPSMSDFPGLPHARAGGARTVCGTPLRREHEAIGALIVLRDRLLPFTGDELALLQSFADQAVIAIANARLIDETKRALERQTATGDVLRIISRSVAHAAPVFDTILESCQRLFNPYDAAVYLVEGDRVRGVAQRGPGAGDWGADSMPLEGSSTGVAIAQRQPVHFPDLADKADLPEDKRAVLKETGGMTVLYAPMISQDSGVGSLVVTRRPKKPFTETEIDFIQSFADQAVIAIDNARLFNETKEALERQTATSEILNVIAGSPTDTQPVFDAIARSAAELCEATNSGVFLLRDGLVHFTGHHNLSPEQLAFAPKAFPAPPHRGFMAGRAIIDRAVAHVPDIAADPEYSAESMVKAGFRSAVSVPMLRNGEPIGAINVTREEARPFSDRQIELLRIFADQAVIAIENTRLFNETKEALAHQTASTEVLRVIGRSMADAQPVFERILDSCEKLLQFTSAAIVLIDGDQQLLQTVRGPGTRILRSLFPQPLDSTLEEAFRNRQPLFTANFAESAMTTDALRTAAQKVGGYSLLQVPMFWQGRGIGAIYVSRLPNVRFSDKEVALLNTFADQAVVAIQNARLFNETKEALERQTATADILKVIASSPDDVQPVFQAIAERSNNLVSGFATTVVSILDDVVHLSAFTSTNPAADAALRAFYPRPLSGFTYSDAIRRGKIHRIVDTEVELSGQSDQLMMVRQRGWRSALWVPLLLEGEAIGVIGVTRVEPGPFADNHVEMLMTFADQAVIAISNVELFKQVQERTRELSRSLDDLRTAQDRLVQTEKLASLGQLTAGIAHEIKNPLNFVNNFSALSVELIDEMTDVFENPEFDETERRKELDEIRELLKSNLEKVVQHGKRADSIVKNMLLHSREGSGEQRPADINALLDESLNLAYHGARAEKPDFNITLQRDLDPHAGAIDVFPQEITRAFINLISNGFYAAGKRKTENGELDFEPILSAATKNIGSHVEVRIRDNGTGIPPEVKEKIFNPFFTTKPAGEGTGLGLSMSHDIIVKQHGGKIEVDTQPGQFTEFTIVLPRATNPANNRKN